MAQDRFKRASRVFIFCLLFVLVGGGSYGVLWQRGYFEDPQVALRALRKLEVPASAQSVRSTAAAGDLATLALLGRAQVALFKPDPKGHTSFHHALASRQYEAAAFLKAHGADLNGATTQGETPLSLLLSQGELTTAAQYLRAGANPNFVLPGGGNALVGYFRAEQSEKGAILLQHGANPNPETGSDHSLLALVMEQGDLTSAKLLLRQGADPAHFSRSDTPVTALLKHARDWGFSASEGLELLRALAEAGAPLERGDQEGVRPVEWALRLRLPEAFYFLLGEGVNLGGCLWLAIEEKWEEALEVLLQKKQNSEQINRDGLSPAQYAVEKGDSALLALLLKYGAKPDQKGLEGQTLLYRALALGHAACVNTLITHPNGSSLTQVMNFPVSKEFRAPNKGEKLLDWYCRNERGITPLMFAVLKGNLEAAELMIQRGANRFARTKNRVFPIQMAAAKKGVEMQQLLIGVSYREEDQVRHFVVDLSEQKVRYYREGKLRKTSRISSGRKGYRTPLGQYVITDKTRHKRSNIYDDAPMPYFQRFSCSAVGFHEGNTSSRFASHGCLRLPRSTAQYFWKETRLGDRVTVQR